MIKQNYAIKITDKEKSQILKDLFTEKKLYVFLVGAGISMDPPSCVPSARMFVRQLFKYYAPADETDRLSYLKSLRYEFLVEKVQNMFDKEIKFLDYLDLIKEPNAIHLFLANMILRYNYIITTNFDYLIELAVKKRLSIYPMYSTHHQKLKVIIQKEDYGQNVSFQYPIIKLHGSKWDCINRRLTKDSLITTLSALGRDREEGKTFSIEPYKKILIDYVTQNRDLIIMGYSGSDDFDISPMLAELNNIRNLVWIDHDPDGEFGDEEIYKFDSKNNLEEIERSKEISKLDKILSRLAIIKKINVFKIKAKTIIFVKKILAPIFHEQFYDLNETIPKDYINFDEYMKENHFKVSDSSKYKFAHEIYYDLGVVDAAERTALRCLELSIKENDISNQIYATNALGLIFLMKGQYNSALEKFEETLQLTIKHNQKNERFAVNLNIGKLYMKIGDLKNALQYTNEANNFITEETPDILKFALINNLGTIYRDLGDNPNAIKNIESALAIVERMGDLFGKALCLSNLSGIYTSQGNLNQALKLSLEALKIYEQLGDLADMSNTLNTIGNIYRFVGNYRDALKFLERAINISTETKNLRTKALASNSMGVIYYNLGKFNLAIENYVEAYNIRQQIGDLSGQATSLNNIGLIHRNQRQYDKALENFNQSIAIAEEIGEKKHLGIRYGNRASIYEVKGEFGKALEEYEKALSVEQSLENREGIANQLTNIGGIFGDLGKYEKLFRNYNDALDIYRQLNIKPGIANALNNLGVAYYKYKKDYSKSIEYLQESLKLYKEVGQTSMIMGVSQNLNHITQEYNKKR
ncbi:MAG: tetratricopeptide repeat protein [Promethearchaeati archaeon]